MPHYTSVALSISHLCFKQMKADDLNVNPKDLVTMSQSELTKCVENEQAMILALNKRKSRGKVRAKIELVFNRDVLSKSDNDIVWLC